MVSSPIASGSSQTVLFEMPNPKAGSNYLLKPDLEATQLLKLHYHTMSLVYFMGAQMVIK